MKRIMILLFVMIIFIVSVFTIYSSEYDKHIMGELVRCNVVDSEIYECETILRKDGIKALLKAVGGTDKIAIAEENIDTSFYIYADEPDITLETDLANEHYLGYMRLASFMLIYDLSELGNYYVRYNEQLTKEEALSYCIKCINEDALKKDDNIVKIAIQSGLLDITDISVFFDIKAPIKGKEFCKLLYKLLNSDRYYYIYEEKQSSGFIHRDALNSITYKELLENR